MLVVLENIFNWFKKLFGIIPRKSADAQNAQNIYAENYRSTSEPVNLTAIIALKLTNIVIAEAKIEARDKNSEADSSSNINPRIDFLNGSLQNIVGKLNVIVKRVFGIGGVIIKPYIYNGQIYNDILPQTRYFVIEQIGEVVTKAGFISDWIKNDAQANSDEYMRLEYHSLDESGLYTIEHRALKNGQQIPLTDVAEWFEIPEVMQITNVNQMLFAFIKCPVDNREAELNSVDSIYGVPVTFGNDKIIKMIVDIIKEIPDEYKNKKAFIGADDLLFDKNNKLPANGLYKLFRAGGGIDKQAFWEIFSPEIRQTSYFEGINGLLDILEMSVGVSSGLLTGTHTRSATATEIEYGMFDTEILADSMHKNIEISINQLVYAFDVIADAFSLSPASNSDYFVNYDWMSWSERSDTRWKQLLDGFASGAVSLVELRQYLFDENKEQALANMPEQITDIPLAVGE